MGNYQENTKEAAENGRMFLKVFKRPTHTLSWSGAGQTRDQRDRAAFTVLPVSVTRPGFQLDFARC